MKAKITGFVLTVSAFAALVAVAGAGVKWH
jgi:hypothetical protein